MNVRVRTLWGPYAPHGVPIVTLIGNGERPVEVDVQPDSGLEIPAIRIPGFWTRFLERRVEGAVMDGPNLLNSPNLAHQLASRIGAWNTAWEAGYHEHTGLHSGFTGCAPVDSEWHVCGFDGMTCVVAADYRLSWATTGNTFGQEVIARRRVRLCENDCGVVALQRSDEIEAVRTCTVSHLEHINPYAPIGSRVILPWERVDCIFDRDGDTPKDMNVFTGVEKSAVEGVTKERCFFAHIRPDQSDSGWPVAVALVSSAGCGIGVRFRYDQRLPFTMIWYSPMTPEYNRAVVGIEHGQLPLGHEETAALGVRPVLEQGSILSRYAEVIFCETPEKMAAFLKQNGMSMDPVPDQFRQLRTDKRGLPTLLKAAGLNGKR